MKQFELQPTPFSSSPKTPLSKITEGLNPQQKEAVTHSEGPLLIVAGAGSGKTRVLTYRIAHLLGTGKAKSHQILALTFTNKAAKEMKERIENLIGKEQSKNLWMGTFHSTFAKILRFEAEHIGYTSNFSIYDTDDSEQVVKSVLRELKFDAKEIKPRTIRNMISSAKNELIDPTTYKAKFITSTLSDIASQVYPIYEVRMKGSNALDFDDLLIKPIELFQTHPDILEKYQDRFQFILIDEYQDTNHAQFTMTKILANKHQNICVVGDDAQSIYAFRGANISNILDFQNIYPKATRIPLEQNYRCTKSILRAADSIIKKNTKQLDKTLWTDNEEGELITLLENVNDREEANKVAYTINQLRMTRGTDLNNIAILMRTNFQSRVFEEALRTRNIPYQLIGGLSFYQRKEIKDSLAYLKLMINEHDEESLNRIVNEPARGIGARTMQGVLEEARRHHTSAWNIMKRIETTSIQKAGQNRIREFVDFMESMRAKVGTVGLTDIAKNILTASGYIKQYVEENSDQSLTRRDNVMELLNFMDYYERSNSGATLNQFLQEISLMSDTDKYDEKKSAVTMMTIHASKGLEFPVIFIVGLEEELFPIKARSASDVVDMEEERRLFYVAITRAKKNLYLSHAKARYKFGEEKFMLRSRFVDEIDTSVLVNEQGRSVERRNAPQQRQNAGSYQFFDESDENRFKSTQSGSGWKPKKPSFSGSSRMVEYDSPSLSDFKVGTTVLHPKFGKGKIQQVSGYGDQTKVVVFFQDLGNKKLLLKFSKLRIVQ